MEGGVEIVKETITRRTNEKILLGEAERPRLVSNLLVVICRGQNASPVV